MNYEIAKGDLTAAMCKYSHGDTFLHFCKVSSGETCQGAIPYRQRKRRFADDRTLCNQHMEMQNQCRERVVEPA